MQKTRTEGLSNIKKREYSTWYNMLQRTTNKGLTDAQYYTGKGIKVCSGWSNSFKKFLADMGDRPQGTTIDRIDGEKGYTCGTCDECVSNGWKLNCRWATPAQQNRNLSCNKFYTFNGKTQLLPDWAMELGFSLSTLGLRIKLGWPVEKAFTTPPGATSKNRKMVTLNGLTLHIAAMERHLGLAHSYAQQRLKQGMSVEEAFTPPKAEGDRKANGQFSKGSSAWKYRTKKT
jgi:hypothetical protein